MAIALVFSLGLIIVGHTREPAALESVALLLEAVDFDRALLHGMLGALLFAGALHVDAGELSRQKGTVAFLASVGVLVSTTLFALCAFAVFAFLGLEISFLYCLLFGAIVAPTDPVAVMGVLKRLSVPRTLSIKIAGESLFNDGIAVVLFLLLLGLATGGAELQGLQVAELLGVEVLGGVAYGLAIGWLAYRAMRSIDQYQVEILLTLAVVTGGYALAQVLHVSGPLAMVVAGLLVGNTGRSFAMSEQTRERLDEFWELADEFLNAILFLLIGLELVVVSLDLSYLAAGLLCIVPAVAVRAVSVGASVAILRPFRQFSPHAVKVLTWGGLRGGISVALALSLPASPERELLVTATYVIVAFSILVQGLSLAPLVRRLYPSTAEAKP